MSLGLTLPNWCTEDVFGQLVEITSSAYDILTYTNALTKLAVGPTIKRFLNNINANELKKSKRKMYLYSAHDTNIISFIRAHNITTPRIADYGSTLLFEKLRGKDKRVYIRVSALRFKRQQIFVATQVRFSRFCVPQQRA